MIESTGQEDAAARVAAPETETPASFELLLLTVAPRAWVTPALVLVLVLCFAGSVFLGVDPWSPTTTQLIQAGALFGPMVVAGQWWRLLSSCFLHIGVFHLLFNLWALWTLGRDTERVFGSRAFIALFLLSAVGGSALELAVRPLVVAAGASGAIFGVCGALLAFILTSRGGVPPALLAQRRIELVNILVINLVLGVVVSGIGLAAHVGGFVTGLGAGWFLRRDLQHLADGRRRRLAGALGLAVLLVISGWAAGERALLDPAVHRLSLMERVQGAMEARDYRRGIQLLTAVLALEKDPLVLRYRATAHFMLDENEEGLADLREALALAPSLELRSRFCSHAAEANWPTEEALEEGVRECTLAIAGDSGSVDLLESRALLLMSQGKLDASLTDIDAALAISPDNLSLRGLRLLPLERLGRLDEAETECASLVKAPQARPAALRTCTIVALRRGDHAAGFERADQLLMLGPSDAEVYLLRARVNQSAGDLDLALSDVEQAVRMEPRNARALNSLAWVLVQQEEYTRALTVVDESLAIRPDYSNALGTRCFAEVGLGRLEAARQDCARAVALDQGDLVDRGMVAFLDGQRREAVRLWREEAKRHPSTSRELRVWLKRANGG